MTYKYHDIYQEMAGKYHQMMMVEDVDGNLTAALRRITPFEGKRVLDLGTGCGILATVLAKEIPRSKIRATDISEAAIDIARINAEKHCVSEKIEYIQGDLWQPLAGMGATFDLIVSNPPYVSTEEFADLPPEVRDFEPRLALDGREGGLYFIREIIDGSPDFLKPGGWLLLEMAPAQTDKALELLERIDAFGKKMRIKDYSHHYRVVCAQYQ